MEEYKNTKSTCNCNKNPHIIYLCLRIDTEMSQLTSMSTLCRNASWMSDARLPGEWVVPMTTTGYSMYSFLSLTTQDLKVPATRGSKSNKQIKD